MTRHRIGLGHVRHRSAGQIILVLVALSLAATLPVAAEDAPSDPPAKPTGPVRSFTVGNSFHWWIPGILAGVTRDAGIQDFLGLGVSPLGNSRVPQHWNLPDENTPVKVALREGKIDVLTMAGMYLPDEGVEKFVRLGLEHNPNFRATLQEYWLPDEEYDASQAIPNKYPSRRIDHNRFSGWELRWQHALYFAEVDELVRDLNKQLGKQVLFVVPMGQAIIRLREKVIAGQVPEVATQGELFHDSAGHPTEVIQALSGYCHFAVIYHQSPVGLPVPYILKGTGNPEYDKHGQGFSPWWYSKHPDPKTSGQETPEDVKLARLLQEIAWDAVIHHPLSGLWNGEPVSQEELKDAQAAQQIWLDQLRSGQEPPQKLVVNAVDYNYADDRTRIADPDAHSGFALQAKNGTSKPGYFATGTFSKFDRFGKYRITLRAKCADNSVTENVMSFGNGGATRAETLLREIKGTDFTAAGKYQDFSAEYLRGDTGVATFFFTMGYLGHADVTVDTVTFERIGDTTDQELVEKLGLDPPIDAKPLGQVAPNLLWVQYRGRFHDSDPFAAAIPALKIPMQIVHMDLDQVYDFPKDWTEMSKYSALVLSDVDPGPLGYQVRALIAQWVRQGGTLIVTGGPHALGNGQTAGTALADLLPVQVQPHDFAPGELSAPQHYPAGCPAYSGQAGTGWMQQTTAKPGAQVVLACNGRPALVLQKVGLGQVVLFTGTPIDSEAKIKPFWTDPAWPQWSGQFLHAIGQ